MRLSVLDLSPIPSGQTATDALAHTVALAEEAERLGMTRYWVAEHHNAASVACSCPEVVIARLGSVTSRMRIGAGGIMLPNHSALKVAETFRVLHAMFPGRVDLGLGRAPGTDPRTAAALRRGEAFTSDDFPPLLEELLSYLAPDDVPRPPFSTNTIAIPANVPAPELYVLSSSGFGAQVAARRGLGLAFAHHMNPRDAVEAVKRYRASFEPSDHRSVPYAIMSVGVVCASDAAEARELAAAGELAMLRFAQGKRDLPLPSVEEAAAHSWDADENALRRMYRRAPIVGDVDRVAGALRTLVEQSGVDELMLLTMTHDQAARRRSYALVAEALG
jgi:luciferase family oxidoreductase group 1